jgi:hypothetical protein
MDAAPVKVSVFPQSTIIPSKNRVTPKPNIIFIALLIVLLLSERFSLRTIGQIEGQTPIKMYKISVNTGVL